MFPILDGPNQYFEINPDSLTYQAGSATSAFTRINIHPELGLLAVVNMAGRTVDILETLNLTQICPSLRISDDTGLTNTGKQIACLQWHRNTLTLAVAIGEMILVYSGSSSRFGHRWCAKNYGPLVFQVKAKVEMANPTQGVAWMRNYLVTFVSPGIVQLWYADFAVCAENSVIDDDISDLPKALREAYVNKRYELSSLDNKPRYNWDYWSTLPSTWSRLSCDLSPSSGDDDQQGRIQLRLRDFSLSPGPRYICLRYTCRPSVSEPIGDDIFQHLETTLIILYKNESVLADPSSPTMTKRSTYAVVRPQGPGVSFGGR